MKYSRITALVTLAASSSVFAGPVKEPHKDVWVFLDAGTIATGEFEETGGGGELGLPGIFTPGVRVFGAELGEFEPNFTDDPGFFANTLPTGFMLGFNARAGLGVWNGAGFDTADESLTIAVDVSNPALPNVTIGPTDVPGFVFATADGSRGSGFDQHLDFLLNAAPGDSDPAAGVYLLELELFSPGAATSLPFWIVFNQGSSEEIHDGAIDWVNENLVPAPGALAPTAVLAFAALRRRR